MLTKQTIIFEFSKIQVFFQAFLKCAEKNITSLQICLASINITGKYEERGSSRTLWNFPLISFFFSML